MPWNCWLRCANKLFSSPVLNEIQSHSPEWLESGSENRSRPPIVPPIHLQYILDHYGHERSSGGHQLIFRRLLRSAGRKESCCSPRSALFSEALAIIIQYCGFRQVYKYRQRRKATTRFELRGLNFRRSLTMSHIAKQIKSNKTWHNPTLMPFRLPQKQKAGATPYVH